jgi:hypothetical protein
MKRRQSSDSQVFRRDFASHLQWADGCCNSADLPGEAAAALGSGDGFYLYLRGIALNSADAHKLAVLAGGDTEHAKWHVRSYRLALKDDAPVFTALWRPEERFTINDILELLPEIPPCGFRRCRPLATI